VATFKFLALPQPDGTVRVVALQPRLSSDPVETLPAGEFASRSAANGVRWLEGQGGALTITTDRFGASVVEERLQRC